MRINSFIQTNRLLISDISTEDALFILNLLNSSKWLEMIGDRNVRSIDDAINYIINKFLKTEQELGFTFYKVSRKSDKESIGICGFAKRDFLEYPDIGFATLPQFEGQGFTSEAASAMLEYGQKELQFKKVMAFTLPENKASISILSKIGLNKIAIVKDPKSQEDLFLFSN